MEADLREVEVLAQKRRYPEALERCEKLLLAYPAKAIDVLRTRAYVLARSGDYEKAVRDRKAVLATGSADIRDYFRGAENALAAGYFDQAASWLKTVLELGQDQGETWFAAAAHFLLAYAKFRLGAHADAASSLQRAVDLEPAVEMPIPGQGMQNAAWLSDQIRLASRTPPQLRDK